MIDAPVTIEPQVSVVKLEVSTVETVVELQTERTVLNLVPTIRPINLVIARGARGAGFTFTQPSPLATWIVNHNLGRAVVVQVYTLGGQEVSAGVSNPNPNQTVISFLIPFAGVAYIA